MQEKNDIKGFLFTSTSEIYGNAEIIHTPEKYCGCVNPIGRRIVYDEGKRAVKTYCMAYYQEYGIPIRIAIIFNTYGPRLDVKLTSHYGRLIA
ncbi:MAG: GDP-mannose 4,6-dehydratase [Candidatus Jordarchaeaceae archaeon]